MKKRKVAKKRKAVKKVVLTPLQKLRRQVRVLRRQVDNVRIDNASFAVVNTRLRAEIETTKQRTDHERATLQEIVAVKDGAIKVREARVAELIAERDRILRLVEIFTSVQITTHGTEQRIAAITDKSSTPALLRKDVVKSVEGSLIAAAQAAEQKQVQVASYRRPMYSISNS